MILATANDAFEVTWDDPADAGVTWMWDEMHSPRPLTAFDQDMRDALSEAREGRLMVVHGYGYFAGPMPPVRLPAPDDRTWSELWEQLYEAQADAGVRSILERDYASMSDLAIVDLFDELFATSARANQFTHFEGRRPEDELAEFAEQHLGVDGLRFAGTMMQGMENDTRAAGAALDALGEIARTHPAVAAAIRDDRFEEISDLDGGDVFMDAFDALIDRYGWRAESWTDLLTPTWAEDPAVPLARVVRYLDEPQHTAQAAHVRSAEVRQRAIEDALARLTDGEQRATFEALVEEVSWVTRTREGARAVAAHASGVLRKPLSELGRRWAARELLDDANDAVMLHVDELRRLAQGELPDARALVAERRSLLAQQEAMHPPRILGAPPDAAQEADRERAWGTAVAASDGMLGGTAASGGQVRGVARVITSLAQGDRLAPGEILVCRSTAPPWTPLLAVAGAVVTNIGGVLSHSAIVAREYAIPAVVGAADATELIPDGAEVTVDGDAGLVTIHG